jgi:hypothetical protein
VVEVVDSTPEIDGSPRRYFLRVPPDTRPPETPPVSTLPVDAGAAKSAVDRVLG